MPFNYNANLVIEQRKTTIPCKSDKNKNWTSKSLAKSAGENWDLIFDSLYNGCTYLTYVTSYTESACDDRSWGYCIILDLHLK